MRPKTTDFLSAKGTSELLAGIVARQTNEQIAARIEKVTGEKIALRTIGRRKQEWWTKRRQDDERFDEARAMLAAAKAEDVKMSQIVEARLARSLMLNPARLDEIPADDAARIGLEAEKVAGKNADRELKREEIQISRERLELQKGLQKAKQTADRALKAAQKSGGSIPVEVMAEIKETLYGLTA